MLILVGYNLTGYVVLFRGTLATDGWLDMLAIRFVMLKEAGLRKAMRAIALNILRKNMDLEMLVDLTELIIDQPKKHQGKNK
jgi:hypothetical protein